MVIKIMPTTQILMPYKIYIDIKRSVVFVDECKGQISCPLLTDLPSTGPLFIM